MKLRKAVSMARRYKTLRKNLRELETKVVELLTLPPGTPHHDLIADGMKQRLDSLRTLVSAEIVAAPSNPDHLLPITERLSELEMAFQQWDDCGRTAAAVGQNEDEDNDNHGEINMVDLGFKVYDVPKKLREDVGEEEEEKGRCADEKTCRVRPPDSGEGEAETMVWAAGRYYRAWATGVVLGAFSMAVFMIRFSVCFHTIHYLGPLTPT